MRELSAAAPVSEPSSVPLPAAEKAQQSARLSVVAPEPEPCWPQKVKRFTTALRRACSLHWPGRSNFSLPLSCLTGRQSSESGCRPAFFYEHMLRSLVGAVYDRAYLVHSRKNARS